MPKTRIDQPEKRTFESVKYVFAAEEIRLLGEKLAQETREAIRIETEKKAAMAGFNSAKQEAEARCADLAFKISNGYEMRDAECIVYFSQPRRGMKTIMRVDTGEIVREDAMTAGEMQMELNYVPDPKQKPQ